MGLKTKMACSLFTLYSELVLVIIYTLGESEGTTISRVLEPTKPGSPLPSGTTSISFNLYQSTKSTPLLHTDIVSSVYVTSTELLSVVSSSTEQPLSTTFELTAGIYTSTHTKLSPRPDISSSIFKVLPIVSTTRREPLQSTVHVVDLPRPTGTFQPAVVYSLVAVGCILLVLLIVILGLIGCVCCYLRKRRRLARYFKSPSEDDKRNQLVLVSAYADSEPITPTVKTLTRHIGPDEPDFDHRMMLFGFEAQEMDCSTHL